MSHEARSPTGDTAEKASDDDTSLDDVVTALGARQGRLLGTDDQGREHCYWPHRGEITVRERDGVDTVTVNRFDLGGRTLHDYRVFVDDMVDDVDVDWIDEVFER